MYFSCIDKQGLWEVIGAKRDQLISTGLGDGYHILIRRVRYAPKNII